MQVNSTTLEFENLTNDEAYYALNAGPRTPYLLLVRDAQDMWIAAITTNPGVDETTPARSLAIQGIMMPRLALAALRWVEANGMPTEPTP